MSSNARTGLVIGVVVIAVVVLVGGTMLIGWLFFDQDVEAGPPGFAREGSGRALSPFAEQFKSNGERIYFTGTSNSGPAITAEMPGMHGMPAGMLACASCHGEDGRGGTVRMMMTTVTAPNIQYNNLTSPEHSEEEEGEHDDGEAGHAGHPPYIDETIKRAITRGSDPAGESLHWMMPRWDMTDEQLDDLIAFLKTLR